MKKLLVLVLFTVIGLTFFPRSVFATEASLRCTPATGTYNVGDSFTIEYILDTRGDGVYGSNVVATFDSTVIEAAGTQSTPMTSVTGWNAPTTNTIDNTLGKVDLDFGNTQASYSGVTTVGQATFTAKAAGQAQFNYSFFQQYDNTTPGVAKVWGYKEGESTLSNILTDVNNCVYVIAGASTPTPGNATATPIPPPNVTELPRAGAVDMTVKLLGIAGLFLLVGGVVPAILLRKEK